MDKQENIQKVMSMVQKDDKYDILVSDIKSLVKESQQYSVDKQIITSVVSGHGEILLSKFIRVPKDTLVVAFVTEGMVFLDRENTNFSNDKKRRITAMNHLYVWMRYVTRVLKYNKGVFKKGSLERYTPALMKNLNQYKAKFRKEYTTAHCAISEFFIMYQENDLIPDHEFLLDQVRFPGIHDWKDALYNSKVVSNKAEKYFGFPPTHPYFKITDILEGKKITRLQNIMDYMSVHCPAGMFNVIFLQSCRTVHSYQLNLRADRVYLYRHLFQKFRYILEGMERNAAPFQQETKTLKGEKSGVAGKMVSLDISTGNKKTTKAERKKKEWQNFSNAIELYTSYFASEVNKAACVYLNSFSEKNRDCFNNRSKNPSDILDKIKERIGKPLDFVAIFYERICLFLGSMYTPNRFLLYFQDVFDMPDVPMTPFLLEMEIPVRADDGTLLDIGLYSMPKDNRDWLDNARSYFRNMYLCFPDNVNARHVASYALLENVKTFHTRDKTLSQIGWSYDTRKDIFERWWKSLKPFLWKNSLYQSLLFRFFGDFFVELKDPTKFSFNPKEKGTKAFQLFQQLFYTIRESGTGMDKIFFPDNYFFAMNPSHFIEFSEKQRDPLTKRDLSFPYTSPIEFGLANFVYEPSDDKFYTVAQLFKKKLGVVDKKNTVLPEHTLEILKKISGGKLPKHLQTKGCHITLDDVQLFASKAIVNQRDWYLWKQLPINVLCKVFDTDQINIFVQNILLEAEAGTETEQLKVHYFLCNYLGRAMEGYNAAVGSMGRLGPPAGYFQIAQQQDQSRKSFGMRDVTFLDVFIHYLYGKYYHRLFTKYKPGLVDSYTGATVMLLNYCLENREVVKNYFRQQQKKAP